DRPLIMWLDEADAYLSELLRREGRGDFSSTPCACGSNAAHAQYRCEDCYGDRLYCERCTVRFHQKLPLHRIKRWSGLFFERVSLKSMGVRVQLGHEPGEVCRNPKTAAGDDFVVLDVLGIHEVGLDFCGCDLARPHHKQLLRLGWFPATSVNPKTAATFRLLEVFHTLSNQSKVSGWEYYCALAQRTDNTGTKPPKDRYRAFMMMIRQWRHLKMMKRAGRGNVEGGIGAAEQGSCVVECPACPQPGKNLPNDWETDPPARRYVWLYRLHLAIDANFRLKRKKVSNDAVDPSLNKGCAYVVEETAYKDHIAKFDNQRTDPTQSCNNHDAVKLATLKGGAGLAASGVATVDCARHDMKRPCSTGDLQKGERYVNIDYLGNSSLQQNTPIDIAASYDISCQYSRKFDERFDNYGFDVSRHDITWGIPKFHINAHQEKCRADYNWHFLPWSARLDGEGVERNWGKSNPAAASTKEMGPGSRRDFLDDMFSHHNWVKVSNLAMTLLKKMKKAVPERDTQIIAFQEYNSAFAPATTEQWRLAVEAWEADSTKPNPFLLKRPVITQASIKRQIAEADAQQLKDGTAAALHEKLSASGVVIAGLEIEEHQRRLRSDYAELSAHPTDLQRARLQERQNQLRRKIDAWADIQQLYMPGVAAHRERLMSQSDTAALSYNIPLLLPSAATGLLSFPAAMLEHEWSLRHAQAHEALSDLRGHLEVRSHLYKVKDRFVRGQRANTRAHTIIKTVNAKIAADAARYRIAYHCMYVLSAPLAKSNWQDGLRNLTDADIRHVTESDDSQSEGRRKISWIWNAGAPSNSPGEIDALQDTLRVEWCKARARARRWAEEVELLQEEMRRVVLYHDWASRQWLERVDANTAQSSDYRDGANAYAYRQSAVRAWMRDFCHHSWRYVPDWVNLGEASLEETL
ncbi:uncharacterized protein TRAVEDRAFT_134057, partial [Trametes versicolor FP-101664 SS1]|uniref:uncharacterized protein n=1 Tax=Trametes versicolor (strain FP-101664) TaxID=717944 RepID=UPI0004621C0B